MKYVKQDSSINKFRKLWQRKGYELINIMPLCEAVIGNSGWCNGIGEPEETIHHLQIRYRDKTIANATAKGIEIIDEDQYCLFSDYPDEGDFTILRKVNVNNNRPKQKNKKK
jgi:hypothetical protein